MNFRAILRFLTAVILFFTTWFMWPRELEGLSLGRDGRSQVPDYAMENAHYISVKAGRIEMETRAKEAAFDMIRHRMEAKNVVALLYNARDERTILTADRAYFYMDDRRLEAHDNVQTLSPDGFLMKAPAANYYVNKRFLFAPQPVEGETLNKEVQVWGNRAESLLDENKLHLIGDARTNYLQPGSKHGITKIRGDSAIVDRSEEKVTFHQNVRVNQEDTEGTGETGELFYSKSDQALKYLSLTKDVKITQSSAGRYTRSQVAEFFYPSDTIVLSGFPAVYHGDDAVTGDKITLYRATGVVEVTATNAAGNPQPTDRKKPHETPPLTKEDEELIP